MNSVLEENSQAGMENIDPVLNVNLQNISSIDSQAKTCDAKNIGIAVVRNKITIPPQSKMLAQVNYSKPNCKISNDLVILEPLAKRFSNDVLVSRTVCSQDHGLFVSLLNLSDNYVEINKGMKVAKIKECIDFSNLKANESNLCSNINTSTPIADFDHADLSWSSDINLDHLDPQTRQTVQEFLDQNKDVFAASVLDLPGCTTIPHTIKLSSEKPVKCKAYRVPHKLRQEMEDQLDILLQANIISPSMSEFASPVILVKKNDGSFRLAVDFRRLNKNLIKDAYPIPNITDSVDALSGANYFSTLDLTSGFFQQVIDPKDRHKTAIITHRGLFEWTRNCFGLSTSGNSFQRLMNAIFGDLNNLGILVYIDDIVVASKDIQSHIQKLSTVFNRLREHKLKLKPSKCTFLSDKIQYLGFQICKGQVSPVNKNVEIIKNFKLPNNRKAVRSFIGTVSFYRRFIPDFSKRSINLINLTKDNSRFCWNEKAQAEFEDLKAALISKPCIALPNFEKEFYLYTDASEEALGAVLTQFDDNNFPHPVAFASRRLKDAESRYSTTERELLALVWATAHFKCYLANTHFFIYTDHAPLTFMLKIKDPTSRMAKWICTLSDFTFAIKYIKGKCNSVADFLSRFVNSTNEESDFANLPNYYLRVEKSSNVFIPQSDLLQKIKNLQKTDPKCCQIADKISRNCEIKPKYMRFHFKDDILVCEDTRASTSWNNPIKLVVPLELVPQVFALTHESVAACHQGFQKTIDRVRDHFYWPGMSAHVRNLIDSCVSCQQRRAFKPNNLAHLQRMPTPDYPIKKIHVDILGPLSTTFSGNKYIISYIDSFSKWPEAYAVRTTTSDAIADTLADFISRYGAPNFIVTDNAKNFVSDAIEMVYKQFGIKHIPTTPYHPAGNAQIERQHRTLINALSHIVDENHSDWDTKLKFALLALRTAVHSSTKLTPASIMFGRNLNIPYSIFSQPPQINYNDAPSFCELLIPTLQDVYLKVYNNLVKASESQENYRARSAVDKQLKVGDEVWLYTPTVKPNQCKKFAKFNSGPFTIIEKLSEVNFKIALNCNLKYIKVVHVDRLTKATSRIQFPTSDEPKQQSTGVEPTSDSPIATEFNPNEQPTFPRRRKRRMNFVLPSNIPAAAQEVRGEGSAPPTVADPLNSVDVLQESNHYGESSISAAEGIQPKELAERDAEISDTVLEKGENEGGLRVVLRRGADSDEWSVSETRGRSIERNESPNPNDTDRNRSSSVGERRYPLRETRSRRANFKY